MATFGNSALTSTMDGNIENYIESGYFQMGSVDGTADSITVKLSVITTAHNVKCALYDSDKNLVTNGVTEEVLVPVQGATATTFNFVGTKPSLTANAWYYISVWAQGTTGECRLYSASSGGNGYFYKSLTYNSYPSSITWITIDVDGLVAIYCTYTEGGGPETHTPSDLAKASDIPIFKVEIPFSDLAKASDSINYSEFIAHIPNDLAKAIDSLVFKIKN